MMQNICPFLQKNLEKKTKFGKLQKKGIQGAINWEEGLQTRIEALKTLMNESYIQIISIC